MNSHRSVTAAITSIPDHSPADNETTDSESLDAEKTSNESITAEENIAEADEETHPAVSFEDSLTVYTGSLSSDITDMNAVAEAVEGTVDSKTRGFQAVDISFRDKDGNEIEPLKSISVTMRSDSIKAATEDSSMAPLVVHVEDRDGETAGTGDSPAATVIETLPDMAENNEGSEVGDSMTGNYVNYNFVAFGILADTVITVRPTDRNQKLEDITLTSAYKASNPDDYIKELDKTSLSYSEFAYAGIEMTAANQTVNFNLGEIVYSSVNNNWTALIDNLPLYNKVNNVFYVYRYKIEEIEVDGQSVADSLYEVTSSVSKDGENTTISNKIKEDAPELPSTGFPCFAHSLPVSRY